MPVMSGEEAFRELREIDPGVKVLLCSGYTRGSDVDRMLAEGAVGFLEKPFNSEADRSVPLILKIARTALMLAVLGLGGCSVNLALDPPFPCDADRPLLCRLVVLSRAGGHLRPRGRDVRRRLRGQRLRRRGRRGLRHLSGRTAVPAAATAGARTSAARHVPRVPRIAGCAAATEPAIRAPERPALRACRTAERARSVATAIATQARAAATAPPIAAICCGDGTCDPSPAKTASAVIPTAGCARVATEIAATAPASQRTVYPARRTAARARRTAATESATPWRAAARVPWIAAPAVATRSAIRSPKDPAPAPLTADPASSAATVLASRVRTATPAPWIAVLLRRRNVRRHGGLHHLPRRLRHLLWRRHVRPEHR